MFGESDSESPRVPSPWDSLTSSPSSPPRSQQIPKLVPEAEEGNVEYKLQLLSPSPARFARLVTQLKWRLLEGGGQAYYELGVADSGTLVGLPRQQLEESLETLEMMAGEIGASVIVVKEIEVPLELSTLAESQLERWDGQKSTRRKDRIRMLKRDDDSPISLATGLETVFSNLDITDTEETSLPSPALSPPSHPAEYISSSLPSPLPFDPALALFTMDLSEDVANDADNESPDDDATAESIVDVSVGLEISSVYKPRPMKKRATHSTPSEYTKKRHKNGYPLSSKSLKPTGESIGQDAPDPPPSVKFQKRRDRRDRRRELNSNTLLTHVPTQRAVGPPTIYPSRTIPPPSLTEPSTPAPESPLIVIVDPPTDVSDMSLATSRESRLIVEALVVRKLSLDEAFLDFEGFSLQ